MGVEGGWGGGGGHKTSMSKDDHASFTVVGIGSTTTSFSANPAIMTTSALLVSSLCSGLQGEWALFKRQQKDVVLFTYYCSMTTVFFFRCHIS
jgi:hypothetical protein